MSNRQQNPVCRHTPRSSLYSILPRQIRPPVAIIGPALTLSEAFALKSKSRENRNVFKLTGGYRFMRPAKCSEFNPYPQARSRCKRETDTRNAGFDRGNLCACVTNVEINNRGTNDFLIGSSKISCSLYRVNDDLWAMRRPEFFEGEVNTPAHQPCLSPARCSEYNSEHGDDQGRNSGNVIDIPHP